MTQDIDGEVAELRQLTVEQLRVRHQQLSGLPSRVGNKDHLVRRIAWWLQTLADGGLSDRARQRAEELAGDPDLLATPVATENSIRVCIAGHSPFEIPDNPE
jgi:hypothetical protein